MSKTNNEAPEVNADAPVTDAPETGSDSSEANGPESISLQDLGLLAQIVDLATQRGAFRGNELSQVGGIYDKLTSFLTAVQEQQDANAEASGEAPEAEAGE
jgi:hypothetical protein